MSGLDGGWGSAPGNQCVASQCQWFSNRYPQPQPLSRVSNSYLLFPFGYFHLKSSGCLKCSMFKTDSIFFFCPNSYLLFLSKSSELSRFPCTVSSPENFNSSVSLSHLHCSSLLSDSQLLHTDYFNGLLIGLSGSVSLLYFLLPTTAKVNFLNTNLIILP